MGIATFSIKALMTPRIVVLAALVLALIRIDVAVAQQIIIPTPYFPLRVGNTWHYRAGKTKITYRVTKHEPINNVLCARLEAKGPKTTEVEYVTSKQDGVYRHQVQGKPLDPPLCLLKLPVKIKQEWKWDTKFADLAITGTWKTGKEEVRVPAGKYKTVTVFCDNLTFGNRILEVKYWFAADVGMVKQQIVIAGQQQTLELERFEAAK